MLRQPRKHQDEDRKSSSNISNLPINKFDTENAHYVIVINGEACTITAEWIVEILLENGLTLSIITDEVEEGKDGDVNTSKRKLLEGTSHCQMFDSKFFPFCVPLQPIRREI